MSKLKPGFLAIASGKKLGKTMEEMLQCSTEEVDTIIGMIGMHGIEVAEETRDYVNNSAGIWSFGTFVVGTQRRVIELLRSRISIEMVADLMEIVLDEEKNNKADGETRIDADISTAAVWVMPTNEELIVARQAVELLILRRRTGDG